MNVVLVLALACLLAAGVISAVQKAWPMALLCLGLALAVLTESGILSS